MMTKQDIKDLLLGKAVRYLVSKNIEYKFWKLVEKIEFIVAENVEYEAYYMGNMEDELYKYCNELEESK